MSLWIKAIEELGKLTGKDPVKMLSPTGDRKYWRALTTPMPLRMLEVLGIPYILEWTKEADKLGQNPFHGMQKVLTELGAPDITPEYSKVQVSNVCTLRKLTAVAHPKALHLAKAEGYSLLIEMDIEAAKMDINQLSQSKSKHTVIPITIDTPKEYDQLGLAPLKAPQLEHKSQGVFAELPVSVTKILWRMARTGNSVSSHDQLQLLTLFTTSYTEEELNSFDVIT